MKPIHSRGAIAIALLIAASALFAEDAAGIVRDSRSRIAYATKSVRSRMVIVDKNGKESERVVDQYTSDSAGVLKKMMVFQKPASVANTRFLTVTGSGNAEDRWIFLPSLGKIRRIAAGEGSGSFLGTDLSYDDISATDRDPELDAHALRGDESLSGKACHVIESVPKDPSYQYSKMTLWIEKGTYLLLRAEYYDRKGALAKVMETLSSDTIQGRLTPTAIRMSTVAAGTSTTIYSDIVKYDEPIPAGVFTAKFLETGRP